MNILNDPVLGELTFDVWWSREYEITIFDCKKLVPLVIQTFDNESISNKQRDTFLEFERNKSSIISSIEIAILTYYKENFDANVVEDITALVNLLRIKIMSSDDMRELGFIFDASFDPELGVGVLLINESIEEVDVQDILLG